MDPAEGGKFTLYSSYDGSKVADVAEAGAKVCMLMFKSYTLQMLTSGEHAAFRI